MRTLRRVDSGDQLGDGFGVGVKGCLAGKGQGVEK